MALLLQLAALLLLALRPGTAAPAPSVIQRVGTELGRAAGVVFSLSSWITNYETAPYTVTEQAEAGWEERLYPASNWVCTSQQEGENPDAQRSSMFWSLFQYIQGENEAGVKMDMTTPVSTLRMDGMLEMCFYLGTEHQTSPPSPTLDGVFIKAEASRRLVTRGRPGWMDETSWRAEARELQALLATSGRNLAQDRWVECTAADNTDILYLSYYMVGYDAPSKLWNRRNEVWFLV